MKIKVVLLHKDSRMLELEVEYTEALSEAAVIVRNGKHYVYKHSSITIGRGTITFEEIDHPYHVNW